MNDDLIKMFGVKQLLKDSVTDIIVEFEDGHQARLIAKGSGQSLRGVKWDNKRPDLIVCHQEGTDVYTPETGWIKNQDYPGAKRVYAKEAYVVEFEDGTKEVVSGDHRYLTTEGWKFPWMLKQNEHIVETGIGLTKRSTRRGSKSLAGSTGLRKKLKNTVKHGLQTIMIGMLLVSGNTTSSIKRKFVLKLVSLLKKILLGKPLPVPSGAAKS